VPGVAKFVDEVRPVLLNGIKAADRGKVGMVNKDLLLAIRNKVNDATGIGSSKSGSGKGKVVGLWIKQKGRANDWAIYYKGVQDL